MDTGWVTFWGWVLVGTTSIFACLAVAVAIGGFFDIRTLLKTINTQHEQTDTPSETLDEKHSEPNRDELA